MEERDFRVMSIGSIRVEDGAEELVRSERMRPYGALLRAQLSEQDTAPFLEALAALPPEERYVWRVLSALKWAFCDLETESLMADLQTLSLADLKRLTEPLQMRILQFSIFVLAFLGREAGEKALLQAIGSAKESLDPGP